MTLLQISRPFSIEHSDGKEARFKCVGCYSVFCLVLPIQWKFCPHCGNKIEVQLRDIPVKKYRDNAGYHTRNKDGEFVKIVPPVFTLMVEAKVFMTEDEWEPMNTFPMSGHHDSLKRYALWPNECYRFNIIPSVVVNLP